MFGFTFFLRLKTVLVLERAVKLYTPTCACLKPCSLCGPAGSRDLCVLHNPLLRVICNNVPGAPTSTTSLLYCLAALYFDDFRGMAYGREGRVV